MRKQQAVWAERAHFGTHLTKHRLCTIRTCQTSFAPWTLHLQGNRGPNEAYVLSKITSCLVDEKYWQPCISKHDSSRQNYEPSLGPPTDTQNAQSRKNPLMKDITCRSLEPVWNTPSHLETERGGHRGKKKERLWKRYPNACISDVPVFCWAPPRVHAVCLSPWWLAPPFWMLLPAPTEQ